MANKTPTSKRYFLICPASGDIIKIEAKDINNNDLIDEIISDKMSVDHDEVYLVESIRKFHYKYVPVNE